MSVRSSLTLFVGFFDSCWQDEDFRNSMAYSFAFSDERTTTLPSMTRRPDSLMLAQLEHISEMTNANGERPETFDEPLPTSFRDALRPSNRAIVITETSRPFRVVNVNDAWSSLCEYSYTESRGKSLGSLLRGPETDPLAITGLIAQLLRGEEAGAILTNYTKSGRKFRNRLRVGPLHDEETGKLTHFIGILQETAGRKLKL